MLVRGQMVLPGGEGGDDLAVFVDDEGFPREKVVVDVDAATSFWPVFPGVMFTW